MKIMKKMLACMLSFAVVVGACFAFTGCDTQSGTMCGCNTESNTENVTSNPYENKVYAYDSRTFTIVKAVNSEGKITETQTLSYREYYIYETLGKGADYANYTMTPEEETAFAEAKRAEDASCEGSRMEFGKDTVDQIVDNVDEVCGIIARTVITLKYEVAGDKILMTMRVSYDEATSTALYTVLTVYFVDGKLETRDYKITSESSVPTVGALYYKSTLHAEVK